MNRSDVYALVAGLLIGGLILWTGRRDEHRLEDLRSHHRTILIVERQQLEIEHLQATVQQQNESLATLEKAIGALNCKLKALQQRGEHERALPDRRQGPERSD